MSSVPKVMSLVTWVNTVSIIPRSVVLNHTYHSVASPTLQYDSNAIKVSLLPNPSHLGVYLADTIMTLTSYAFNAIQRLSIL